MSGPLLFNIGALLILVGFILAFILFILLILNLTSEGKVKGGGAIIIGPFPIVFGTDRESVKILFALSIVLVVLLLIVMIFSYYAIR